MKKESIPKDYKRILWSCEGDAREVKREYGDYIKFLKARHDDVFYDQKARYRGGHYEYWIGVKIKGQSQSNKRVTIRERIVSRTNDFSRMQ